jgi:hypothetical protein
MCRRLSRCKLEINTSQVETLRELRQRMYTFSLVVRFHLLPFEYCETGCGNRHLLISQSWNREAARQFIRARSCIFYPFCTKVDSSNINVAVATVDASAARSSPGPSSMLMLCCSRPMNQNLYLPSTNHHNLHDKQPHYWSNFSLFFATPLSTPPAMHS